MPTYPWDCEACDHTWEVVTSISSRDEPQACPNCKCAGRRNFLYRTSVDATAAADWNATSWNPGLGAYVSPKQASKVAKKRGLIEVGNEKLETVHKHFDQQREKTREDRWTEAGRDKLYD